MKLKKILIVVVFLIVPQLSLADRLINDMQACQGLIEFVDKRLDSAPAGYDKENIAKVRKGLDAYNQYIQNEIVSPGLLQFNGGDKAKADGMQKQVDTHKQSLVKQFEARYPGNKLFSDHAIALNSCAKQAAPDAQALEDLKVALHAILSLAKVN